MGKNSEYKKEKAAEAVKVEAATLSEQERIKISQLALLEKFKGTAVYKELLKKIKG